jgi:hypothetical protein
MKCVSHVSGFVSGFIPGLAFVLVISSQALAAAGAEFVCRSTDGGIVVSNTDLTVEAFGQARRDIQVNALNVPDLLPAERGVLTFESGGNKGSVRVITVRSEKLLSEEVSECGINQPQMRGPVVETFEKVLDAEVGIGGEYKTVILVCEETKTYGGRCEPGAGSGFSE